jgi:hypothetical protein
VAHVSGLKAADSQLQARDHVEGELAGDAAEGRDQERRNGVDGAPPPRRGRSAGAATGGGEGTPQLLQRRCSGDVAATGEVSKAEGSTVMARTASDPEELGQEGPARRRSSRRRGGRWERGREEAAVAVAGSPVPGRTDGDMGVARS